MSLFSRVFRKSRPKPESFVVRWSRQRTTELKAQNEITPEVIFISFLNYLCTFATPSPDVEQNDQSDAHAAEVLAHYANDSALFELGCSVFVPIVYWLNAKHPELAEPVVKVIDCEFVQVFTKALQIDNVVELVNQRCSMYREFGRSEDTTGQVRHHLSQLLLRACDNQKPEPYDPARDAILIANENFDVTIRALAWIDGLLSMLESFDRDSGFWDSLGRNVAEQRKRADAACREAIKLNPGNQDAWYMLGLSCDSQGRHDEAVAAFRQAIKLKPDDPNAWYALGWAYGKQGRQSEALDALDYLRKLDPSLADKLAEFLSSKQAPATEKAAQAPADPLSQPDTVTAPRPTSPAGSDSAGRSGGDSAISTDIGAFLQATKLKPDDQFAWFSLGNAYHCQGKYDDAVAAFREAIKLKPDYAIAWCGLGSVFAMQGKRSEALDALDHLRKLDPSLADALADLLSSILQKKKHCPVVGRKLGRSDVRAGHRVDILLPLVGVVILTFSVDCSRERVRLMLIQLSTVRAFL